MNELPDLENKEEDTFKKKRSPKFFKLIFNFIIFVIVFGFILYRYGLLPICFVPIKYSIGNVDSKFKISNEEVLQIAKDAEKRWDNTAGKNVLEYDPSAKLKINLVYDQRQADYEKMKEEIEKIDQQSNEVSSFSNHIENLVNEYEQDLNSYNSRLKKYNESVSYWNKNGGAPQTQYVQLEIERKALEKEAQSLEKRRLEINKFADIYNAQTNDYNDDLSTLKDKIDQNKDKIITQGLYYPSEDKIDVFTFDNSEELRLVLMHELGHAFGIDHSSDENDIMFSILGKQNLSDPKPTQNDLDLFCDKCRINF